MTALETAELTKDTTGLNVVGTSVGTEDDARALLLMASQGKVKASITTFEFEKINEVVDKLARFEISGRAVLFLP